MNETDVKLTELVKQASDMVYQSNTHMGMRMNALGEEKRMANSAQINAASDLREFLEQYEKNQKAQEKESRENRKLAIQSLRVAIAAAIFGGGSLVIAVIALAAQLSR